MILNLLEKIHHCYFYVSRYTWKNDQTVHSQGKGIQTLIVSQVFHDESPNKIPFNPTTASFFPYIRVYRRWLNLHNLGKLFTESQIRLAHINFVGVLEVHL